MTMTMKIKTNYVPRLLLDWCQLTLSEKLEFDYITSPFDSSFFRYRGNIYDLGEAMVVSGFDSWDGHYPETAFSGVLVRVCEDDNDYVVVGRYYS